MINKKTYERMLIGYAIALIIGYVALLELARNSSHAILVIIMFFACVFFGALYTIGLDKGRKKWHANTTGN